MRKLFGVAAAALALAACSPEIHDTGYQAYAVQLAGPDPVWLAKYPNLDPFAATQKYVVTVRYFEDAAGTVPWGKSLADLPDPLKGFQPVQKFTVAGSKTTFTLGDGNQVLPQVSKGSSIFVSTEVVGFDDNGAAVARARCPVQELQPTEDGAPRQVTCTAFYGLIGKWSPAHGPITPRFSFAAAALPDGRVVIAGGIQVGKEASGSLASVEVYDPTFQNTDGSYGNWDNSLQLGQQRSELTASVTDDGLVFFAGGKISSSNYSNFLDVFDGGSTTMKPARQLATARAEHASAPFNGNTVLIAGGKVNGTTVATGSELATATGATTDAKDPTLQAREYGCLVPVNKSLLLYCGGATSSNPVTSCETFDGNHFTASGTLTSARADVKCASVGGNVYLVGGIADASNQDAGKIAVWSNGTVGQYDSSPLAALTHHALAVSNGKVVVAGGYQAGSDGTIPLATGFWFDPVAKDGEHAISGPGTEMLMPRAYHQMVALPDGTVMAIGGKTASGATGPGAEIFVVPDSAN